MNTGFFAYSGTPSYSGESIEDAIHRINNTNVTTLKSWKNYSVSGKIIIKEVINAIDDADYFCADLTGFSDNVLFELGYALSKDKPIWLILDTSHTVSKRRFDELGLLRSIGYTRYHNTNDIEKKFFIDNPFRAESGHYKKFLEMVDRNRSKSIILFLKSQIDTNYSQTITNCIMKNKLPCITDDSSEVRIQSLTWYLQGLNSVNAVLTEFSSTDREGFELQNSKCSLISGMALGLDLNLLMVSEEPYKVPIDYQEFLIKYDNQSKCKDVITSFLRPIEETALESLSKQLTNRKIERQRTELQKINFGEYLAEQESNELYEYYIETSRLTNILKNEYNIVVGRKGSGKTATLYFMNENLTRDPRNHVCLIKPIDFELDALLHLLKSLPEEYEKSYLIESVWKFLIYTEVSKSVYENLKSKPLYALIEAESSFINFIESKSNIFLKNFSVRLEEELSNITNFSNTEKISDFKVKVSEALHEETLRNIRDLLSEIFDKGKKIIVLIDNLDKSWRINAELEIQSKWILGLLGLTERIIRDLYSFRVKGIEKKIGFHLTIFLRSDIFKYIIKYAIEPDKIAFTRLEWNDREILFRIIEERFVQLNNKTVLSSELWEKYITEKIDNMPIKEYIYQNIMPRPRDIIYFFKEAQDAAIMKGHSKIEVEDVQSAHKGYSSWFFTSLIAESKITVEQMESFLYELVGSPNIINKSVIVDGMKNAKITIDTEEKIDDFIDYLASVSIIGREIRLNEFRYEYDAEEAKKIKILANKFNSNRFRIHNALLSYLECSFIL